MLITADGLAGSATDAMGTLVHEAAHAIAFQRGIKDTSRQGRYHNKYFKAIAEEIGLEVSRDPERGWSVTALSEPAAVAYRDTLAQLAGTLRAEPRRLPSVLARAAAASVCCVSAARGFGQGAPCPPSAAPSAAYVAAVS